MFCHQCGAEAKSGAKFCHACGKPIEVAQELTPTTPAPVPVEQVTRPDQPDTGLHPWRRFFARTVDLLFLAATLYAGLFFGLITIFPGSAEKVVGTLGNPIGAAVLAYLLWVPVEAALLANFGTTPAKWIFGIRVLKFDGRKLTFAEALKRAAFACILGDGFGIPGAALFTRAYAYDRLKKTETTAWDMACGSVVHHSKWGAGRVIGATAIVAAALIVFSVLTVMEKQQEKSTAATPRQVQSESGLPTSESAMPSVAKDNESVQKLRIAAEQGDALAQYNLGLIYFKEKNYTEALRWVRLSADQGNPLGQDMLGNLFFSGFGVTKDSKEAVRLYRLAADQGVAGAIYSLGFAYGEGEGVPQNDQEAARLFRIAADQGYATAQYRLGSMYDSGTGVPKDAKAAIRFYGLAADQGYKAALSGLAGMYCGPSCFGVYPERAKSKYGVVAYALYNLASASDKGYVWFRDQVWLHLSESQIEAGQALTREMAQGKPTQVIARYLKTGSAAK